VPKKIQLQQAAAADAALIRQLRRRLLAWYDKNHRDLPWRAKKGQAANPYHVFVSEAMLQQTQVATVIDYFNRFIKQFPTVQHLAAANEQSVLSLWQGLGYYRRARNLHAAAKQIVNQHDGLVPDSVDSLLDLPGVGKYTAGAIASIAHGVAAPILDGNVARVLARWFAIEKPIDEKTVRDQLWHLAEKLVPQNRPGDFNQALMELGALICAPKSPQCLVCSIKPMCEADKRGVSAKLPKRLPRRKPKPVDHHTFILQKASQYLFQQRPSEGLWSNMWQMPTAESFDLPETKEDSSKTTRATTATTMRVTTSLIKKWIQQNLGVQISKVTRSDVFEHATTHRSITFTTWKCTFDGGRLKRGAGKWLRLNQAAELPMSNPQRKIIKSVEDTV
jgi:A/G-specific adenine glycosylase